MSFSRATRRGTSNLSKSYSNHASESSIKVQKKNMKSSHVNNNASSRAKIQRVKNLNATVTGMIKHLDQSIDRAMVCLIHHNLLLMDQHIYSINYQLRHFLLCLNIP